MVDVGYHRVESGQKPSSELREFSLRNTTQDSPSTSSELSPFTIVRRNRGSACNVEKEELCWRDRSFPDKRLSLVGYSSTGIFGAGLRERKGWGESASSDSPTQKWDNVGHRTGEPAIQLLDGNKIAGLTGLFARP
jgi:hypothetical protein